MIKPLIDLDADPYLPNGWTAEEHQKGGQWKFNPSFNPNMVESYLSKEQKEGGTIEGNELLEELEGKPVFNANLIDDLLARPEKISGEFKKDKNGNSLYLPCWGTIYRHLTVSLCVRCLYWDGYRWNWCYRWLSYSFSSSYPAILRRAA